MDVRFCEGRNHRREAHVRAAGSDSFTSARSSVARVRRPFFLLDKDLHGGRQTGSYPGGLRPSHPALDSNRCCNIANFTSNLALTTGPKLNALFLPVQKQRRAGQNLHIDRHQFSRIMQVCPEEFLTEWK